jgi:FixJ family two-component response regulator
LVTLAASAALDRLFVLPREPVDAALAEVQQNPGIDIIMTESALPGTTGLEFCLQLHQLGFRIPIVFVSSTRNIKVAVEAMKLGVEDFLGNLAPA